jgi:SAM-dependent methyltransferase
MIKKIKDCNSNDYILELIELKGKIMNTKIEQFIEKTREAIATNCLHKIIISNRRNKKDDLLKITIRPIELQQEIMLTFLYKHNTNDITKNYTVKEGLRQISELFNSFSDAVLFSSKENVEIKMLTKRTIFNILAPTLTDNPSLTHNRKKDRLIEPENNVYLKELKIVASNNTIMHSRYDKFRQINKFIEIVDNLVSNIAFDKSISIVDMGSGKGYLTFAVYDYLTNTKKLDTHVTGVDARDDLVKLCNNIAQKASFENLKFEQGYIANYDIESVDVLIALHACDTATDEAIFKGITSNAKLIICAPCCHKQIRKQLKINNKATGILKHGILAERQAELITDGIRSLILEYFGYKTKVFEFIAQDHTAKNIMITAEKIDTEVDKKAILEEINAIKKLYGIKQHFLEKLLNING